MGVLRDRFARLPGRVGQFTSGTPPRCPLATPAPIEPWQLQPRANARTPWALSNSSPVTNSIGIARLLDRARRDRPAVGPGVDSPGLLWNRADQADRGPAGAVVGDDLVVPLGRPRLDEPRPVVPLAAEQEPPGTPDRRAVVRLARCHQGAKGLPGGQGIARSPRHLAPAAILGLPPSEPGCGPLRLVGLAEPGGDHGPQGERLGLVPAWGLLQPVEGLAPGLANGVRIRLIDGQ